MNENQTSMLKQTMTFGAIIALILVVYGILLYILDLTFNKVLGYVQYVVLFIGIFLATKTYRDKSLGGFISYGKALGFGVLISVFVGIVTIFFGYIMMRYIDPGLIDKYLVIAEERLQNSRFIPEDQIPDALERSKRMIHCRE